MNLPVIFDIIISLLFIYLILSLLTSEIQELVTTLLQWRAEHLKKSIEVLFGGGGERHQSQEEIERVHRLSNLLYDHPMIADLNQEAKGALAEGMRQITHFLGRIYRQITKRSNIFGNRSSGPSFLPLETFAVSLLETIDLPGLIHGITQARLTRFKDQKIAEIYLVINHLNITESLKPILEQELQWLMDQWTEIVADVAGKLINLSSGLDLMADKLSIYVQDCQVYLPETESSGAEFKRQFSLLEDGLRNPHEKQVLMAKLQPSIMDIFNAIRQVKQSQDAVIKILGEKSDSPIYAEIVRLGDLIPEPLKESLYALGKKAKTKATFVEQELMIFQQEIEAWFNYSMERSSGVYRRNARGIGIILGTMVAVFMNADTILMVKRLSSDSIFRETVNKYADSVVKDTTLPPYQSNNSQQETERLEAIQNKVNQAVGKLSLPLGWTPKNVEEQRNYGSGYQSYLKRVIGWLLTGIALSMGASFWFDLLGKIVPIRNVGKVPDSSSNQSSSS